MLDSKSFFNLRVHQQAGGLTALLRMRTCWPHNALLRENPMAYQKS